MSGRVERTPPLSPATKAWRFLRLLARPALARKLGTLVTEGYLIRTGWVRSVLSDAIVDADGRPLPWMVHPFIAFIEPRLHSGLRVFEYGSGASTLFFAQRTREVLAVEHDRAFAAALAGKLPGNARVIVRDAGSNGYMHAVAEMQPAADVITIDGLDRVACAKVAAQRAGLESVVVLDDSQLSEYAGISQMMRAAGFRALDFWGLAAGRVEYRCTTVFYRTNNVLGI